MKDKSESETNTASSPSSRVDWITFNKYREIYLNEKKKQRYPAISREQLNKIKEGDILVAPMTTPWYLPALKKSVCHNH